MPYKNKPWIVSERILAERYQKEIERQQLRSCFGSIFYQLFYLIPIGLLAIGLYLFAHSLGWI